MDDGHGFDRCRRRLDRRKRADRRGLVNIGPGSKPDNDDDRTFTEYLADKLDVTVSELREAEENARTACIESLGDRGDLTDEQAVALRTMLPGQVIQGIVQDEDDIDLIERAVLAEVADAFDMTRQELREELDDGRNLQQIAQERNIDMDDARTDLQDAADNVIDNLEQAGLIDQGEAQELSDRINQMIDDPFHHNNIDDNDVTTPVVPTPTPDNDDDNGVPGLPNNNNN